MLTGRSQFEMMMRTAIAIALITLLPRLRFWSWLFTGGVILAAVISSRSLVHLPRADGVEENPRETPLGAVGAIQPRLSPDGTAIVFSYHGGIWRVPPDGGAMRRVAGVAGFAFEPCWSPDGRRIAFLNGNLSSGGLVRVVDAHSGTEIALPQKVYGTGKLHFRPDGTALLGRLRLERQPEAFRALDLKTGTLTTVHRALGGRQPWALSEDGQWIAYVTTRDVPEQQSGNDGPQVDVWKVPSTGGEPQRMVRFPARIYDLCWSADGKALYVSSDLGGAHNDIWRIRLDDPEHATKLTFGQADEDRPSVSRDGRMLLFTDNHEGCPALVLRAEASGAVRPVPITRIDFGVPTGRLRLKVRAQKTGRPLAARVALEHADGSSHAPPRALWRYQSNGIFFVNDTVEFDVPAGSYRLRAWHGPEYRRQTLSLAVRAGETTEQVVTLDNWDDANARGWYSGENHIHANYGYGEYYQTPATLAEMCAGEALNVANFMVANSDGDGVFDREFFRGRLDPSSTNSHLLYWNEEFRSTIWGHMTLVNLKQVVEPIFTGFKDTTNPYDIPSMSDIAWKTQRQGGLVNYTHPASLVNDLYRGAYSAKGLPIYAALGKIDTMDIMGSNAPASTALYHRLFNCGFRLAASAGTDCFLNRLRGSLPGTERVYVKIDGPFTYEQWIANLRAGRSFVTNGPLLDFSVNGKMLGAMLKLPSAEDVTVRGTASSQYPLDHVEVLYNGEVIGSAVPVKGALTTELERRVRLPRSGWLLLRASGPAVADIRGDRVYAQTSPVYVVVGDKRAGSVEDAQYFLRWIDRLWDMVQERDRFPDQRSRDEIRREVEQARTVYQQLISGGTTR